MDRYLIFDLGGTSVKYAVSDKDGAFDTAGAFATPREGMERMLEEMERVYEAVQTGPGVTEAAPSGGDSCGTRIVGAAISSPGAVDIRTGMVGGISAIPYIHGIPLAEAVSRRLNGIPVTMENDGNCAALGEPWKGAAAGRRNMVSVVCGTGIGGAIVVDGRVYRGRTNNAGEFGNYLVNREGGRKRTWSSYTMVNQAEDMRNGQEGMPTAENCSAWRRPETAMPSVWWRSSMRLWLSACSRSSLHLTRN